jgi:hypothetical protein
VKKIKRKYLYYIYENIKNGQYIIALTREYARQEMIRLNARYSKEKFKHEFNIIGYIKNNPYRIIFLDKYKPKTGLEYEHEIYLTFKKKFV